MLKLFDQYLIKKNIHAAISMICKMSYVNIELSCGRKEILASRRIFQCSETFRGQYFKLVE